MNTTYTYELIAPSEITASDLCEEIRKAQLDQFAPVLCARVQIDGFAEHAEVVFLSSISRAGIAWGAVAQWTDAVSVEDCIGRNLNDEMVD